ncbi:hypothetical protein [Halothermothrix orenii]|uniref:Uncharacterized protein n=1 Tax=Halothermothrix orenii (strain H 168 / OCM 544 / DSM 9562) TaxID=373903 RepID=B8D1G4_HALOH|nr:hypothetical protein [Halothermothrix orenii]ACL69041.1 hypothetical protein Hore_02800 [Halothermothrix orenii H 168]
MEDFKSLKILDRFKFIFEKFNIDYKVMREIVRLKLIMDQRRRHVIFGNTGKKEGGKKKNQFKNSLIIYGFYGFMVMMVFLIPVSLFLKMSLTTGFIMFFMMSQMLLDFSSVLLDLSDKLILLPGPLNSRTLNAAKLIHIFIYLTIISLVLVAPTLFIGTIKMGLSFLFVFFIEVFLMLFLVIFITACLYGLILKFFDGEKLKNAINYFQIGVAIILPISYQFVGDMFDVFGEKVVFTPDWWTYLLPPVWFAGPYELFLGGNTAPYVIGMTVLTVLVPVLGLLLYLKLINPYFEKNLSKLNNNKSGQNNFEKTWDMVSYKITGFFCKGNQETVFFRFIRQMLSRERRLKLSIYPVLGFAVIFPFIMLKNEIDFSAFRESLKNLSRGVGYYKLYLAIIFLPSILPILSYSEHHRGSWIYRVLPIRDYNIIHRAKIKAVFYKYNVFVFGLLALLFGWIYGLKILDDLLIMGLNMVLLTLVIGIFFRDDLPFTKEMGYQVDAGKKKTSIFILFLGLLLGGFHFISAFYPYLILIYGVLLITAIIVVWRKVFSYRVPGENV